MTTAESGRGRARGGAVRWARAAAVALLAALAVLLHHEIPSSAHATAMAGMARTAHAPSATMSAAEGGHDDTARASSPAAHSDGGVCSGMATQHCSTAGVDGVTFMPPNEPWGGREGDAHATPAGRFVPGAVSRAPPDLSVLSRLLL
ncbi:hypothetical protein [Streptomyces sp. RTd22]|uniref:hypothetical protein n=1 Tax=Streptomyces sp. RTd22 TaxID=1841249 RepID=UPI0007C4F795|nr:hypothetical protein [Streptomyces sp. RTd22]